MSSYVHILPFTISLSPCPSLEANISKRHSDNPAKTLGTLAPFAHAIISSTLRKHSSFTPPSLCAKHSSFQRISRISHTNSPINTFKPSFFSSIFNPLLLLPNQRNSFPISSSTPFQAPPNRETAILDEDPNLNVKRQSHSLQARPLLASTSRESASASTRKELRREREREAKREGRRTKEAELRTRLGEGSYVCASLESGAVKLRRWPGWTWIDGPRRGQQRA